MLLVRESRTEEEPTSEKPMASPMPASVAIARGGSRGSKEDVPLTLGVGSFRRLMVRRAASRQALIVSSPDWHMPK